MGVSYFLILYRFKYTVDTQTFFRIEKQEYL